MRKGAAPRQAMRPVYPRSARQGSADRTHVPRIRGTDPFPSLGGASPRRPALRGPLSLATLDRLRIAPASRFATLSVQCLAPHLTVGALFFWMPPKCHQNRRLHCLWPSFGRPTRHVRRFPAALNSHHECDHPRCDDRQVVDPRSARAPAVAGPCHLPIHSLFRRCLGQPRKPRQRHRDWCGRPSARRSIRPR
jgi:hypothetical protein